MRKPSTIVVVAALVGLLPARPAPAQPKRNEFRSTETAAAEPAPYLLNIVVLDKSGSMADGRLDVARRELIEKAKQLPPEVQSPWVVIAFDDQARSVRTFTAGCEELERHLQSVAAEGGTSIASGLAAAIAEAGKYARAPHVAVYLYTDGEDTNQQALLTQEAQLDKLFQQGSELGLGNTVICRRWGTANGDLVTRLKKGKHARVVDAGEARLVHATYDPEVTCAGAQWREGRVLEIEVAARVAVRGQVLDATPAPLALTCTTAGVRGDLRVDVRPGDPSAVTARLLLPLGGGEPPSTVRLSFDVSSPAGATAIDRGLLVATMATDRLMLDVPVPPPPPRRMRLSGKLTPKRAARWTDPFASDGEVDVELTLKVDAEVATAFTRPLLLVVKPATRVKLASGGGRMLIDGPGTTLLPLTLSFGASDREVRVALAIETIDMPPGTIIEPASLEVEAPVCSPAPIKTLVSARTASVGRPRWTDLAHGLAAFRAELDVVVEGPMRDGTILVVTAPPGVRAFRLTPQHVHAGRQSVQLDVLAHMREAPHATNFQFALGSPPPQGAVSVESTGPIRLSATGPAPAGMVILTAGGDSFPTEMVLSDTSESVELELVPAISGIARPGVARGITSRISVTGAAHSIDGIPAGLFSASVLSLAPFDGALSRPIFVDSVIDLEIKVAPDRSVPWVSPAHQKLTLRRQAPFKRIVFAVCTAGFVVLIIVLPLWFITRLGRRVGGEFG